MLDCINLQKKLGYKFNDVELLINALTHSSYASEKSLPYELNNERLEFIGDGFLDAIIGNKLFNLNIVAHEGTLSQLRAELVCETSLADIARNINLGQFLYLGKGELSNNGNEKDSILSDALEAVFGALVLDAGYNKAEEIILSLFKNKIQLAFEGKLNSDFKSKLQEIIQNKYKNISIKYLLVSETGPDHAKTFTVNVQAQDKIIGIGKGKSKAKAEQAAAKDALSKGEI